MVVLEFYYPRINKDLERERKRLWFKDHYVHKSKVVLTASGIKCADDCSCGRHKFKGKKCPWMSRKIPKCLPGCSCGKHFISDEHRKNLRESHLGKAGYWTGKKRYTAPCVIGCTCHKHFVSASHRENLRKGHLGHPGHWKGKKRSIDHVLKGYQTKLKKYGRPCGPVKDTKDELLTEKWLISKGVKFEKQVLKGQISVDFFLPEYNTCLLVDGCYWHGCGLCFPNPTLKHLNKRKKDADISNRLVSSGYVVKRIWGHDVYRNNFRGIL